MDNTKARLRVVPMTPAAFSEWCRCARAQGYPRDPLPPKRSVVLVDGGDRLVSAVGIHETDGSILMAEDFVTNPEVPIGVRVEAVQYTIEAVKAYASMSGRLLMATVSNQHLGHLMAGNGFRQMPGVVMFYPTLDTPVAPVRAILTKKEEAPEEGSSFLTKKEEAPEEASSADMDKGDIVSTGDKPDKRSVSRRKKRRPVKRKVKK